jgi:hypothetical protein
MVLLSGMNKRKPIKIELYCHTAPRSGCAESSADEIMEAYEGAGYAVVFIPSPEERDWPPPFFQSFL